MKNILIGERYRKELEKSLVFHGFQPVWMPDNPLLDPRLAGHTDLSAIKIGSKLIVSKHIFENKAIVKKLTNRGMQCICSKREQNCAYPKDVNLCACVLGDIIIHNSQYTDEAITEACGNNTYINVNQGYANCMILALGSGRMITADKGIASAAKTNGMDVLLISSGHIKLEGFAEGFIGGASFVDEDTVYFTGDIRKHPDAAAIEAYIDAGGQNIVSLSPNELFDVGSAAITEI